MVTMGAVELISLNKIIRNKGKIEMSASKKRVFVRRMITFLAYICSKSVFRMAVSANKDNFVLVPHDVAKYFFGSNDKAITAFSFMENLGLIKFKKGISHSSSGVCGTVSPSFNISNKSVFVKLDNEQNTELSRLFSLYLKYWESNKKPLTLREEEEYRMYKEINVDMKKADNIFYNTYGMRINDIDNKIYNTEYSKLSFSEMRAFSVLFVLRSINTKMYKITSKYGRLYTAFHQLKKVFRECLLVDGKPLFESFDVHASLVLTTAELALKYYTEKSDVKTVAEIENMLNVLETSDFYKSIDVKNLERAELKKQVLTLLFCNKSQRNYKCYIDPVFKSVYDAVNKKYPSFVTFLSDFEGIVKKAGAHTGYSLNLSTECQRIESVVMGMLNKYVRSTGVFSITLHDAIFTNTQIDTKLLKTKFYEVLHNVVSRLYNFDTISKGTGINDSEIFKEMYTAA